MARVRALGALTLVAVTVVAAATAAASPLRIESSARISGASPFADDCGGPGEPARGSEVEAHLAVDPKRPKRMLAAWQQDRHTVYGGSRGNAGAVTTDGGRKFSKLVYPNVTKCGDGPRDRASDPWVSFGSEGTAYAAHLTFDYLEPYASGDLGGPTQLVAQTSSDGGRSFGAPVTVVDEGYYDDREALTADPFRPNRAYMVWTRRLGVFGESGTTEFSLTTDGGRSWSPHTTIYVPGPSRLTIPTLLNALPDSTLVVTMIVIEARYAVTEEPVPFEIRATRSTDDGATWSSPVLIGETVSTQPEDPDGRGGLRALPLISTAVAPSGAVYSVWNVIRSTEESEIVFTRSADAGETWSEPATLAKPRGQAFIPGVAVAGDGTIGVLWDDTRKDRKGDEPLTTDVWFAHSHDDGRSWSESHVAGPFDALKAAPTSSTAVAGRFIGDYQGLVEQPRGFAALYPQTPPAAASGASDVFFARLATSGEARPRLRLTVRPRRARAGVRVRFRFQVTRPDGARRRAVRRARVRFAGRAARTNARGRATIRARFRTAGTRRAVVRKRGFRPGRAVVRVTAR